MAEKEEREEEEIVAVGDGVDEEASEREDEDLLDEEHESRLAADEGEDDRSDLRAQRKVERKGRKQRQREAKDRDQRELGFLRTRNETLERRFSELDARVGYSEVSQVDGRINQIKSQIKLADQVIAKAVDAGKGADLVEAQGIRDNLRDTLRQLDGAKVAMTQRAASAAAGGPEPADPNLMVHATSWMQDHNWWDPNGGDEDSLIVSAIDAALVNEDYDPTTKEYWDELSARVDEKLPHRSNGDARKPRRRAGGPAFRTGGRERPLRKNEVYISPERKEAMIEAGVWEDPETRQRYLKQYADYDREAQT